MTTQTMTIDPNSIPSNPATGKYRVTNIYVDPATGKPKMKIEYDDTPAP